MASVNKRDNDDLSQPPSPKRVRVDESVAEDKAHDSPQTLDSILPPSHALLGLPPTGDALGVQVSEKDVGISEYIGHDVAPIHAIIKQRFTDFLVYEVDLDHEVVHLKSLAMPSSAKKVGAESEPAVATSDVKTEGTHSEVVPANATKASEALTVQEVLAEEDVKEKEDIPEDENPSWKATYAENLARFLSDESIGQLKQMYEEGPEPPRISDNGWVTRPAQVADVEGPARPVDAPAESAEAEAPSSRGKRSGDRGRGRGRGRGGRDKRGGQTREDPRKIVSKPMDDKAERTALHKAIRELFGGKLESQTDTTSNDDEGSRIMIKWARVGGGGARGGARTARGERGARGDYPPYIHFTLQKTNRDTQDALAYISRTIHCNVKDLSVAGTKDKRGVTVQRVSLRRGNRSVEDIWKAAHQLGRRSMEEVLSQRGERGVRIADLNYRKAGLELGMLKGNAFVITLRGVQVDSMETIDKSLSVLKHKGFINYYGMQRFGTAAVPTHSIGLAFLKSDWHKAVSLILQKRPGEHPDVEAARDAWLTDGDLDRALALMPRRVVAERCVLESFKKQKGDTRNAMGALSTIPRNLRLMYIHAYQSYVWNAIVSERIRIHGCDKPVPGDLVFTAEGGKVLESEGEGDEMRVDEDLAADQTKEPASSRERKRAARAKWEPPSVKTLTESDVDQYSIFDVIMPLPGRDVSYPGGKLGDRYREFLVADGLDPDNFIRKQKEYTLNGSYRKILQLPKDISWSVLKYTDPDVPLAQADEDALLGFDAPAVDENGKFLALQVRLTLGTAAYATMALREVTKMDTSSHFQSGLTLASEDQKFRGLGDDDEATKKDLTGDVDLSEP
ncbi:tRNA pseudouridine synthase D [Coniophora puteana RWD-64-598 SS2]|uniref:tRNA pseudouridine synthase D n=1 Tax=Coniophora puteana (strain RWD-64-598) TaxID=741705 RepID=A0A5M3MTU3_CONPW|nr:tRNA pseudouridine synthase D [Coniophora puteana RWD-64-598 SS2]EIW82095.1 tRNA pseudouridine synthase D [Coniophora puteana RWD-64-598 SS2]